MVGCKTRLKIEKKTKKTQQIIIQEMIKYMFKNDPLKNIANRTQKCNRFIVGCSLFITTLEQR